MNAETAFAMTLGDEQEKLSAHFDAYTADELAELLMEKSAGGTIVAAKKLTDKEKKSSADLADAWGRELAHEDVDKVATGLGSPLGTGSLGPKMPTVKPPGAATMGQPKVGSVGGAPKIVTGAARLREEMDKLSAIPGAGLLASGINKAAPYLAKGVRAVGGATMGQAAGYGAGAGAIAGAGRHLMSGRDPQTGQKRTTLLGSMAGGAALGAGAGLGARAGAQQFQGTGLHKRMTNGAFQFAGKNPQQTSFPGIPGSSGPDTVPINRPGPAAPPLTRRPAPAAQQTLPGVRGLA